MDEKETQEAEKKPRKQLTYERVDQRHAAYKVLVENGVEKTIACQVLGYKSKSCYEIEKRLEKKGKRIEVTTQKMIRKSVRNLEKLVDAEPFGTLKNLKDSTVLAAILSVLDRSHPKKAENSIPTYSFTAVNLEECKPDYSSRVITIENPPIEVSEGEIVASESSKMVGLDTPLIPKGNID